MSMKSTRLILIVLGVLAAISLVTACGGGGWPEEREFDLEIRDRKLNLDPAVIQVKQGDTLTLNIRSDENGAFHLHGYDLAEKVGPGITATMSFVADATGKFNIEFHSAEEKESSHENGHEGDEEDVDIGSLEVLPR